MESYLLTGGLQVKGRLEFEWQRLFYQTAIKTQGVNRGAVQMPKREAGAHQFARHLWSGFADSLACGDACRSGSSVY